MRRASHLARRLAPLACGLAVLASSVGCAATRAENGALAGSLIGAAAGAAIGEANDNPLAGALLGGVGGAVVGSAIGDDLDRTERAAVRRASHEQAAARRRGANAVTVREVIELTAAGVDPDVIRTHVRQRGGCGPLAAADLVTLQHNGVDPRVVAALQTAAPPRPGRPGRAGAGRRGARPGPRVFPDLGRLARPVLRPVPVPPASPPVPPAAGREPRGPLRLTGGGARAGRRESAGRRR